MNLLRFLTLIFVSAYGGLVFANDIEAAKTASKKTNKFIFSVAAVNETDLSFKLSAMLLNEISKKTGDEMELIILPPEKAMVMLQAGRIDAEIARIKEYSKDYNELIMVNEPVATIPFYAYSMNKEIDITNIKALKKLRVAYVQGQIFTSVFFKDHKLFSADSVRSGLLYLYNNQADIFVTDGFTAHRISQAINTAELGIYKLEPPIAITNIHTFFNSKHTELAKRFEKALLEIKNEEKYKKVYKEHIN